MKYEPWLNDIQKEYYLSHEKSCVWCKNSFIDNSKSVYKQYNVFLCKNKLMKHYSPTTGGLYASCDGILEHNAAICKQFIRTLNNKFFEIKIIKK